MVAQFSSSVYDQIAEFVAAMEPMKEVAFRASEANQMRLDRLLDKQKDAGLSFEEKSALEHCLIINRIIGLAKTRALKMLSS